MSETIERHGVVVEHKGFKIGDEVYSKMANTKGVLSEIITDDRDCFRVLFSDEHMHWHEPEEIEHLADYDLRTKREEFEKKFKGKKIRLEDWDNGEYVIFDSWNEDFGFNCTGNEGDIGLMFSGDNWQILEEPEEDYVQVAKILNEEPDLSKLAGCWYLNDNNKIRKIDCFRLDLQEPLIDEGYRSYYDLKQFEIFKFCKRPSKDPEDYKDIDTFLRSCE